MTTVRDLAIGAGGLAAAAACGRWAAALAGGGVHTVEELVALSAACLAAVLATWYSLTAGTLLLTALTSRGRCWPAASRGLARAVRTWGAPLLRGAAVTGVGAGLSLGLAPAWADSPAPGPPIEQVSELPLDLRPGFATIDHSLSGPGSSPASGAAHARPVSLAPSAQTSSEAHLVRPGDSLWSISAGTLGPDATDAQIAAEWPRWYAANRGVIGPDPHLIHPGQELVAPEPKDSP